MSARAPSFVVDFVSRNAELFKGQASAALISAESTKATFAAFLYGFLTQGTATTGAALCVYATPEEREAWLEVAVDVIKTARGRQAVNVTELDREHPPPTPYIALVDCRALEQRFPKREALADVEMRPENAQRIAAITRMYSVTDADHRAFAAFDTPVNYTTRRADDPYSLAWDHLVFSRGALELGSVYYLNAIAVYYNRFLLDDVLVETDDPRVLHAAINASPRPLLDDYDCDEDELETLGETRDDMYAVVMIDDALVNFAVLVEDDEDEESDAEPVPTPDVALPPLRSVIKWESIEQPCVEKAVDLSSRVSVMWVYHPWLADAHQRGWAVSNKRVWGSSSVDITEEHYAVIKTMAIYQYVWINHARKYYILCPYVSKSHELHKLRNARALHPDDMLIGLLREEDTLIVYDTLFAAESRMRLAETRCRLIFAAFCGTLEEEALARFLFIDRGVTPPRLPTPLRISPIRMRRISTDPRRLRLHRDLTSIIFYDPRDTAHTTLYECMLSTYDHVMATANRIYYNGDFAGLVSQMAGYYSKLHVATRADTLVCRIENAKKQQRVVELVRAKQRAEMSGDRNARREATREMWTAIHNYYRLMVPTVVSHIALKKTVYEFDVLGNRLYKADIDRLVALNEWLGARDEELSVRIAYNENAVLLRQRIDSAEPPAIPSVDDTTSIPVIECPYCDDTFDSVHFYRQHKLAVHKDDDGRTFHCSICGISVKGEWAYIKHNRSLAHFRKTSDAPHRYVCGNCDRNFERGSSYWSHTLTCKNQNQLKRCEACEIDVSAGELPAHQLTPEHQRRIAGPEQTYCQNCRVRCLPGREMKDHLESETHMSAYIARGHIVPITIALNRWYVLLAAAEKLIDPAGYYVDMELRRSLLMLPEAKATVGEEAFTNYCTLLLVSMVMPPSTRKFYFSADQCSGMLVATVSGRTGIVGHYGAGDKTVLLAEMFKHMGVESVGYGFIAYVPSGLHTTLVEYARFLDMKIVRSPASTTHLGRLGVYAAYRLSRVEPASTSRA